MAISSSSSKNSSERAIYSLVDPTGIETKHEVYEGSHYNLSWYDGGRRNELFHVGGGNPYITETAYLHDFGTYRLTPQIDFFAWVDMWGAGGGNYGSGDSTARGGGGGFTKALIQFKANIPYALVIGQAGRSRNIVGSNVTTHGGGGGPGNGGNGGQGGGLTGIFMGSTHIGRSNWEHNSPVTQSQAILIAGGGGGPGHHGTSNHGQAGGGGGWSGHNAHNSGGGSQYVGGYGNSYSLHDRAGGWPLHGGRGSQQSTWVGGGGGGWWGGGSGSHSSSHHNGGSGGSGHHAYPLEYGQQPNNEKAQYVFCANTERAPGCHSGAWQYAANYKNVLAYRSSTPTTGQHDGLYAGKGGRGNTETGTSTSRSNALHGKIVITLAQNNISKSFQRKGVSSPNITEWTNQNVNTEN